MENENRRRSFLKTITLGGVGAVLTPNALLQANEEGRQNENGADINKQGASIKRNYNAPYRDEYLNRVAFPVGGIGAGMFCIEGSGAISHMSVRNKPEIFNEPGIFAAICIKGLKNGAKVLEGSNT